MLDEGGNMRRLLVLGAVAIMLAACATNYSHDGFIGEVLAQGITPAARSDDVRGILAAMRSQIFKCWSLTSPRSSRFG